MTNKKLIKMARIPTGDGRTEQIEEAAYYSWLNRERYAQVGDELNDWIEAEKEVLKGL